MKKTCKRLNIRSKKIKTIKYKKDNILLSWMEFKMRISYNKNQGSLYTLNRKEKRVIGRNLNEILNSEYQMTDYSQIAMGNDLRMICDIYDDIRWDKLCRYNKRVIILLIDKIRIYWNYMEKLD